MIFNNSIGSTVTVYFRENFLFEKLDSAFLIHQEFKNALVALQLAN